MTVQKKLVFIHIPKAAGSTLKYIIERQYPHNERVYFNVDTEVPEFIRWPEEKRHAIRALIGPQPYGMGRYLGGNVQYITTLREPLSRVISHYYYVLRSPEHYLYRQVTENQMGLIDYILSDLTPELDNGQTRLLSGMPEVDGIRGNAPVTDEVLEAAKNNLRNCLVGLATAFDASLLLFAHHLGWKHIYYEPQNVGKNRPAKPQLPEEIRQQVLQRNRYDTSLYEFAQQLHQEQLAAAGIDAITAQRFQEANRHYQKQQAFRRRLRYIPDHIKKQVRRILPRKTAE